MRWVWALLALLAWGSGALAQTLNPGDQLDISVLQDSKLDRRVIIDPSGQIAFPLAGRIQAAGMTPAGVEKALKAKLRNNFREGGVDVTVALTVVAKPDLDDDLKPKVFVMGEVARPGPYTVRRQTTIVQAIALAGGLGPYAARNRIQIRRQVNGAETTSLFNYRAFEQGTDVTGNMDIQSGDVIIVPERGVFELF